MTNQGAPVWRSMLFVPANMPDFIAKAHLRGADAIILDLEDSIPLAEKAAAQYRGAMIDAPVVARAREILASHEKISSRGDWVMGQTLGN